MKTNRFKTKLAQIAIALCAIGSAHAIPFTARSIPAGLDSGAILPPESVISAGYSKLKMTAADFNGDGHLSWYAGGNVISHFPKPGITTLPEITLPQWSGATVKAISGIVFDVDKDGDMDIVRINEWNGFSNAITLQVFINNGSGNFSLGYRADWTDSPGFNSGWRNHQLAIGDYDRDGDYDLAILKTYQYDNLNFTPKRSVGSLVIRWNVAGAFGTSSVVQSTGFHEAATLVSGDLDHDGDDDVLVSCQSIYSIDDGTNYVDRSVKRFVNDGAGTFTADTLAWSVGDLLIADLDRDGWADLLGVSAHSVNGGVVTNEVRKRTNNKEGAFFAPETVITYSDRPGAHAIADVNEDGIPDLIIAEGSTLAMRPGVGNGSFGASVPLAVLPSKAMSVSAADSDRDGDVDVMVRLENGSFRFIENRASRLHPAADLLSLSQLADVTRIRVADMNRDGINDLLALTPADKKIHLLLGQANGTFAPSVFKLTQSQEASDLATGDFNRDGKMDFAYTIPATGQVRVVLQNDTGFFSWTDTKIADMAGASMIRTGNYARNNGTLDLMVGSTAGDVRWFSNNNSASSWTTINMITGQQPAPSGILTGAFNPSFGDQAITLTSGNGPGGFSLKGYQHFLLATPPWFEFAGFQQAADVPNSGAMALADIDHDGGPELVFVNGAGSLKWWKPDNNEFNYPTTIDAIPNGSVRSIAAVDWNMDGRDDIVCTTTTGLYVYIRNGFLWTRHQFSTNPNFKEIAVIDFDRDGRKDLAVVLDQPGSSLSGLWRIFNRSSIVVGEAPGQAAPLIVQADPGTHAVALRMGIRNPGRPAGATSLADPDIVITGTKVRFFKAVNDAGQWSMGAAMTKTEVQQIVTNVLFSASGKTVASGHTSMMADDGTVTLSLGTNVPIPAGQTLDHTISVALTTAAAQAASSSFYLVHSHNGAKHGTASVLESGQTGIFGHSTSARIDITQPLTALQEWRQTHFGVSENSGAGANDADPDGDGVPNLIEYLMGRNPKGSGEIGGTSPALGMTMQGNNSPLIADLRLLASYDPNIRITIEHTFNLADWSTLSTRTGTGAWTGVQPTTANLAGGRIRYNFATVGTPATQPRYFLRLIAEELP